MQKIFSFPIEAGGQPVAEHRAALLRDLGAVTPWLGSLELPLALQNPAGVFIATLWGSKEPWNTAEGLAEISGESGGTPQDPRLESLFPLAARLLLLKHRAYEVCFWDKLHLPPTQALGVVFPALGASWNEGVEVSPLATDWGRLNHPRYRTAKTFGLRVPLRRCERPTLGAGPLFPIDGQGRDIPNGRDTVFLQIHR
ncbi:MAG TPA: hypothetical protein VJJ47_02385 [Candidatus Paceibacterota bacterium]